MKIYDISMKLGPNMPAYAGKASKRPTIKVERDFTSGAVYETRIEMNAHTGTHIDMPLHMLEGGKTVDTLDLGKVIIKCRVVDIRSVEGKIRKEHLLGKGIKEGDFILLKTQNSYRDILEGEFISLDETGAVYLSEMKVTGVGIDSLGIERGQPGHGTHKALLGEGIVILEGLRLKEVEEGEYMLVAAPLNIAGAEAAPVRAVLLEIN